jgi:hypothetical protein
MYKEILEKIQKNEDQITYSEEEVFKIVTDMLLKKCEENAEEYDIEELRKNWRKGVANLVAILGLTHGAHFMANSPGPKTEREKSPTYQRIERELAEKKAKAKESGLSDEEQIQQSYEKGKAEADEIFERNYENSRDKKIDDFLHNVSGVESSFGRNTKHKMMESGIHAKTSAYGNYGLMPKTINELANRMDKDNPLKTYNKMTPDQVKESLNKNPDHQHQFAKYMANHLYDKHGGDENKMAYTWTMGHNLETTSLDEGGSHGNFMNHHYVQKYNKFKNQQKPKTNSEQKVASNNLM